MCLLGYCLLLLLKEKTENLRKKLRKKLRTQGKNSKTQGKNSRFRQIHLVELPKTGPISKPELGTLQFWDIGLGHNLDWQYWNKAHFNFGSLD